MRVVIFCHSLLSDWNHGNAHFLRGVCGELLARGHAVHVYEPKNAWSVENLVREHGEQALDRFHHAYPMLQSVRYEPARLELDQALDGADLVLVHEWNDPALIARIGEQRRRGSFRLFFHDTHHRAVSDPAAMAAFDLRDYDGVLAFGAVIRDLYLRRGWSQRAWTWHEAADTRVFRPLPAESKDGDLVWIGNWGDEERTRELHEFLLEPARALRLRGALHGVRYPEHAKTELARCGLEYRGWVPNFEVPKVFAHYRLTIHVPRRPYVEALPGIPTIRPFEALACGIPLISAPWRDEEGLFTPGRDFLVAANGDETRRHIRALLCDPGLAQELAEHGRRTLLARHTCAHRADELLSIYSEVRGDRSAA